MEPSGFIPFFCTLQMGLSMRPIVEQGLHYLGQGGHPSGKDGGDCRQATYFAPAARHMAVTAWTISGLVNLPGLLRWALGSRQTFDPCGTKRSIPRIRRRGPPWFGRDGRHRAPRRYPGGARRSGWVLSALKSGGVKKMRLRVFLIDNDKRVRELVKDVLEEPGARLHDDSMRGDYS